MSAKKTWQRRVILRREVYSTIGCKYDSREYWLSAHVGLFYASTGAVQHQRLAGQEQGSDPGVRCTAHAGVEGTARGRTVQGARGRHASRLIASNRWYYYLVPATSAKYCDERVCMSVCLSVRLHTSKTTSPNFTKFSAPASCVSCGRGSVLLWRQYTTLCTSGFVDDVMFSPMGQIQIQACSLRRSKLLTVTRQVNAHKLRTPGWSLLSPIASFLTCVYIRGSEL